MSRGHKHLGHARRPKKRTQTIIQYRGGYTFVWNRKNTGSNYANLGIMSRLNNKTHLNEDKDGQMIIPETQPIDNEAVIKSGASTLLSEREPEPLMNLKKQVYWSELILKHGTDYKAMERDVKLNSALYSETKCKKMCELYLKQMAAPILPEARFGAKKSTKQK